MILRYLLVLFCASSLPFAALADKPAPRPSDTTALTNAAKAAKGKAAAKAGKAAKPTGKRAAAKGAATIVALETTKGVIKIELFRKKAPITTANFLKYTRKGFYNNTIFHRVIRNFMIQGGGVTRMMERKPTTKYIRNEADNGLSNSRGTIAMARTGKPHSASAQFFINVTNNRALDHRSKTARGWGYCVFGKVISGMKVVDAIRNVLTTTRKGRRNVPMTAVVIKRVFVVK